MNIAQFAVTRPVAVTMRIAGLVLLGLVCLTRLPVDLLPNVTIPIVAVVTQWPNVSPEEIETQITRPMEEQVSSVEHLDVVTSTSEEGVSTVRVQFKWGTDIGQAAVDVLQLAERAQQNFPTGDPTLQPPIVFKYDPSTLPILIFGVSGINDPVKLNTLMTNEVAPMVESADGVASAVVSGGNTRAIMINANPGEMRAHNISLPQIVTRIAQENQNIPGGIAKESNTEYTLRTLGWFTNMKQIEEVPLSSSGGETVSIGDVATVSDSHTETRMYTRLNQKPCVGLIIVAQSGVNTIATTKAVMEKIAQAKKIYPELKFSAAYNQSVYIANSINDLKTNALLGGIMAVLMLLFFLRNVESTLVVALSIPISISTTFALLYVCGYTLNTMSLGGLALATGLIVDDAVVVLENIFRHIERDHKSPMEAAVSGTNEVMSAVVASTITVSIVFLPLMLIKGQAGQMFGQFAIVVIFSIAISLLDATTTVPMLTSRLVTGAMVHHEDMEGVHHSLLERIFHRIGLWFTRLDETYRHGLRWSLSHRWWVIILAALVTMSSLLLVPQIGTELMPQTDSGDFNVMIKMPPGTALTKTDQVVREVEADLAQDPDVGTAFAASGTTLSLRGTSTALYGYEGSITVRLKDNHKRTTMQVMDSLRKKCSRIPGARIFISEFDIVSMLMTGGNQNVELDIFGDNLTTLYSLASEVMKRIRPIPGLQNVDVNWQESSPEIQWSLDRQKALQMGVTTADMSYALDTATNGTIASYYQENGFSYPITVDMPENRRKTVGELMNLPITPSLGGPNPQVVTLGEVAHYRYGMGPSQITRLDRQRYIAVTGTPEGRSEGDVQAAITKAIATLKMPKGYYTDWGIWQKHQAEEFGGLGLSIVLAIMLIYVVLASQFESFIHPLTILASVPLSAVGVILGLFLTGRSFGLTALIGMLMLVGIVVKNGILLVDYTNVLRSRGMERNEAVLTAGPTRLRPILMTASAASLGMLPIALALGKGGEINAPMATVVIGGLTTSTFLTLFIVPTVYTLFDDMSHLFYRRRRERQSERDSLGNGATLGKSNDGRSTLHHNPEGSENA